MPDRKIIHIDADAFYASVEMRENPDLAKVPLAVGGSPQGRGVISTCNYLARRFGVKSAMPSSQALRLCPDLQFVRPNFPLYKDTSQKMKDIFFRYTELVEPLSLDEAYLDVTQCEAHQGSATRIAQAIKAAVKAELQITVSAGVAPNKFLAKVASDWQKPDGLFVITPEQVTDFVKALPVNKINGVGKVTFKKLQHLGIETCADIEQISPSVLHDKFGKYGQRLIELSQGIDHRPVTTNRIRKSLSVEHTFDQDLDHLEQIMTAFPILYEELSTRQTQYEQKRSSIRNRIHKRFVKLKFSDFSQTTLETTMEPGENWNAPDVFKEMVQQAWLRREKPIRLMGLGLRYKTPDTLGSGLQLELFT